MQRVHRVKHLQRVQDLERVGLMRTVTHPQTGAAGIQRHLQIMGRVTNHQHPGRGHAELRHQLVQHARVRLASGLICRAGTIKHTLECHAVQRFIQTLA